MVAEQNAGFAAGIAQRSKVQRLAWALKGAPMRKKDLHLSALAGVAEGRKLRDKVTRLMRDAEANPEDAIVLCVFAEPDLSALAKGLLHLPVVQKPEQEIAMAASVADKTPIGFQVWVKDDSDPEAIHVFGHFRPLIVEGKRGVLLNALAFELYGAEIQKRFNAA